MDRMNVFNNPTFQAIQTILTQKVDQITGSEMKKVELQRMNDDLTIKVLKREYLETKRTVITSKKKLDEAHQQASSRTEIINQLEQARTAITAKFGELQRFQYETLLTNLNNSENRLVNCKSKNSELSNVLQIIFGNERTKKIMKEQIQIEKLNLDREISKQIETREEDFQKLSKTLFQLQNQLNSLKDLILKNDVLGNLNEQLDKKNFRKNVVQLRESVKKLQVKKDEVLQNVTLNKLKVSLKSKEKESAVFEKELQDKLKKCADLLKKQEKELLNLSGKQQKIDIKVQDLQSERDALKEKLVSKNNDEEAKIKMRNHLVSPLKKQYYSWENMSKNNSSTNKSLPSPKPKSQLSSSQKAKTVHFALDADSSDSEDDLLIDKLMQLNIHSQ
ncbi:protein Hook homolog 3-like [Trichogramma pretiosum]|uniref:protein Hook homolog 3-like n=1 Tax=Trichogramma pretiosum TaxID=7493 RepID=UPI000C71AB7F|nr:protein Hook homolog 3-like [Trichogramma pretiosum]